MSETDVSRAIGQYLDAIGAYHLRLPTGGRARRARLCPPGTPDRFVLFGGRSIFVEVKDEKGVQSPAQRATAKRIERCGGVYLLVRSVAELDRELGRIRG